MKKKENVLLTIRKKGKYRRKDSIAVEGKLSLKVTPEMRQELDSIATSNRISVNFLCACAFKYFLQQYRMTGEIFAYEEQQNAPRPGRKRIIHEVEE